MLNPVSSFLTIFRYQSNRTGIGKLLEYRVDVIILLKVLERSTFLVYRLSNLLYVSTGLQRNKLQTLLHSKDKPDCKYFLQQKHVRWRLFTEAIECAGRSSNVPLSPTYIPQGRNCQARDPFLIVSFPRMGHCCLRDHTGSPKPMAVELMGQSNQAQPHKMHKVGMGTLTVPASRADETRMHWSASAESHERRWSWCFVSNYWKVRVCHTLTWINACTKTIIRIICKGDCLVFCLELADGKYWSEYLCPG